MTKLIFKCNACGASNSVGLTDGRCPDGCLLPPLSVRELFTALLEGRFRDFNGADHTYFDAPAGSRILEADDASWMYIVSSEFRVEAHGLDGDDDPVGFIAVDGNWVRA